MMRSAFNPSRFASFRYSSTTARTSRGGTLCKSKTSVIGMRTGSGSIKLQKLKKPGQPKPTGPKSDPEKCAHPMSSDPLSPILAHDRFHLIFQVEFQLLHSRLLHLLFVRQVGKRAQAVQLRLQLRVLLRQVPKLLVG